MSRLTWRLGIGGGLGVLCIALAGLGPTSLRVEVAPDLRAEVVVVGVPRPVQLALDRSGHLVILSHGWRGDAAAELYRFEVAALPLDATRSPRVVIPFSEEHRQIALGSLALDPRSGDLFMGEENGNRLVVLDYTSPEAQQRSETPPPASFEGLDANAYHGPVVVRLDPRDDVPLPRRFDLITPILPGRSAPPPGVEPLFRFISAAATSPDGIVLLDSVGQLFALTSEGVVRPLARLPAGHYHRTHMAVGADGSVFVSSGFQIRKIFRVSPSAGVTVVAQSLGDPEGIAVDDAGDLYVAENALHRVIRIRSTITLPRASPR